MKHATRLDRGIIALSGRGVLTEEVPCLDQLDQLDQPDQLDLLDQLDQIDQLNQILLDQGNQLMTENVLTDEFPSK